MSFVDFLKGVAAMLFGYVGGGALFIGGMIAHADGYSSGLAIALVGFIVVLYGVYHEREL